MCCKCCPTAINNMRQQQKQQSNAINFKLNFWHIERAATPLTPTQFSYRRTPTGSSAHTCPLPTPTTSTHTHTLTHLPRGGRASLMATKDIMAAAQAGRQRVLTLHWILTVRVDLFRYTHTHTRAHTHLIPMCVTANAKTHPRADRV